MICCHMYLMRILFKKDALRLDVLIFVLMIEILLLEFKVDRAGFKTETV